MWEAYNLTSYTGKSLSWLITGVKETNAGATPSSFSERLTDEEIAKWWGCIFDALTVDDKTRIIKVFKLGGLNALFKSDLITSTQSKLNSR